MRSRVTKVLVACLVVLLSTTVIATCNEFREFPEFRYTSALPGGGWGVTPSGVPGFDGAMQINVPVAYTPHRGAIIGYSSGSLDSNIHLDIEGPNINGTGWIGLGLGDSGRGLFLCEAPTSRDWEPVQSFQQQFMPERVRQPAVAFGVQDVFENRDRYIGAPNDLHDTMSPYFVATKQIGDPEEPIYVTFGWGWGRFNSHPIGGVSWRAHEKLTVMAEYDGFNPNAGVAFDLSDVVVEDTILFGALVDLERPVIGLSYVYDDLAL